MRYYYARVSSKEQNLARQLKDVPEGAIVYMDKASGKDMDRPQYQELKSVLKSGDELYIHSLDRLGRNKKLVRDEFEWFKANGIKLRIGNMPSTQIDYGEQAWIGDMVNNIILEVLSSFAEQERKTILQRQKEGIDAMDIINGKHYSKKTGNKMGRAYTYDFSDVADLPMEEAMEILGCSRSTYYKRKKEWDMYHLGN